jgi:hypothetical protein
MSASALPAPCPRCAAQAPRVLSATAIARTGPGRKRRGAEPALVTVRDRQEPRSRHERRDPLKTKAAAARASAHVQGARPWMLGH